MIVDIDETVLDNSDDQAWLITDATSYRAKTFGASARAASSRPVPGSLAFLNTAAKRGVTVFYLSNRAADLETATRRNLLALGYPVADDVGRGRSNATATIGAPSGSCSATRATDHGSGR